MAGVRAMATQVVTGATATNAYMAMKIPAPANWRIRVEAIEYMLSHTQTAAAFDPVLISVGTWASGAGAIALGTKVNTADNETLQTAILGAAATTGTLSDVRYADMVSLSRPSGRMVFPPGRDFYIIGGEIIGILVTIGAVGTATLLSTRVNLYYEE